MVRQDYPRRVILILLGVLGLALGAAAQQVGYMGAGARGMALGHGLVADGSGQASAWYNPALAAFTRRQHVEVAYALLQFDRKLEVAQFAMPLRPRAGVTAGLVHAGISGIDGRDGSGFHTETHAVNEFVGFLAFGLHMNERLTAGIALRFYYFDLLPDLAPARTLGLSLGWLYRLGRGWTLGGAVDDLLARYTWRATGPTEAGSGTLGDTFPLRLRVGGSYRPPEGPLLVVAEYESRILFRKVTEHRLWLVGGEPVVFTESRRLRLREGMFRMGVEYRWMDRFWVRGGVDHLLDGGLGGSHPALGFGLHQRTGELDIRAAYTLGREGSSQSLVHMVSLRFYL